MKAQFHVGKCTAKRTQAPVDFFGKHTASRRQRLIGRLLAKAFGAPRAMLRQMRAKPRHYYHRATER
ncbi:MAG TPA: hypothetical protein VNS88_03315, partial [Nitrospiraceae bacterium]|nr:hypothetical protein [Nitrospiraceae bacterium]